jgi:hypothetical protein
MITTPHRLATLLAAFAMSLILLEDPTTPQALAGDDSSRFVDLSLLVAPE